jgi:hypothetical protein
MTGEQRNPCPISEVSFLNVCKLQPFEEAHIDMPSYPVVRYRAEKFGPRTRHLLQRRTNRTKLLPKLHRTAFSTMVRSRSQSLYSCGLQSNLPLGTSGDPNGIRTRVHDREFVRKIRGSDRNFPSSPPISQNFVASMDFGAGFSSDCWRHTDLRDVSDWSERGNKR